MDSSYSQQEYNIGDCFVIADDNDHEIALSLLEHALEARSPVIIIEPQQLGEETSRWIRVGNCLHKTAVLSAAGCVALGALQIHRSGGSTEIATCLGLGISSVLSATIYATSWQFDPCCKYQPVGENEAMRRLPVMELVSTSPVILVRRDDTRRKWLHNLLTTAAALMCVWRIYCARR